MRKKNTFHPKKRCVQSRQEKWKCIRKDKRVSRRHTNSSKKDGSLSNWKNVVEGKPIKFQKKKNTQKKKKRLLGWKTERAA